ncbi:MAG TPA: P-II family nitrogen regulator [Afifellaceae bacterium]|nr:P-II family nitrogen regulator [Afifellaceae bacterium]
MKFIVAIIQPHRLDLVRDGLTGVGVHGLTVSEVRGYGRQKGHKEIYRGAEYQINYVPKLKLEIALEDNQAEDAIAAIRDAAQTGKVGDGKVFVLDLQSVMRIRTGETDSEAL